MTEISSADQSFRDEEQMPSSWRLRLTTLCLLVSIAGSTACPASAAPITYTLSGIATGSIGANNFTNAAFTFTGYGDDSDVSLAGPGVFANELMSASIDVSGIGTGDAVDPFNIFVNQSIPGAGFTDVFTGDVIDFSAAEFASYDLASPLGPVDVDETFLAPFDTTAGTVDLSSTTNLEFTATTAIPEPSSGPLLGMALMAFVWFGFRCGRLPSRRSTPSLCNGMIFQ
jgi:hypothetical protein